MDISCHQLWNVGVGQSQTISQGKSWVFFYYCFVEERSCYVLKPSTTVLGGHPQLHCAQAVSCAETGCTALAWRQ